METVYIFTYENEDGWLARVQLVRPGEPIQDTTKPLATLYGDLRIIARYGANAWSHDNGYKVVGCHCPRCSN